MAMLTPDAPIVGLNTRVLRTLRGWTQAELINRCEPPMSSTRIVQIERAYRHRPPSSDEIHTLAKALGVVPSVLTNPLPAPFRPPQVAKLSAGPSQTGRSRRSSRRVASNASSNQGAR